MFMYNLKMGFKLNNLIGINKCKITSIVRINVC